MWADARWVLLFGTMTIACSGRAETPPTSAAPAPPPPPTPTPSAVTEPAAVPTWLYEIRTDGEPSYVFAALDPGCPLHASFPPDSMVLFEYARQVVVVSAQTDEEGGALLQARGLDPSASLPRRLGPDRYQRFAEGLRDTVPAEIAMRLTPTFGLVLLGQSLAAEAFGTTGTDGRISPSHDAVVRRRMAGRPLMALADGAAIERSLVRMSPVAEDTLTVVVDHLDDERQRARERLEAYRAGDEAALMALRTQVIPGTERAEALSQAESQRALEENLPRIETEIRTGNALVLLDHSVVLGERGLLARLRQDGFEITRVSVTTPPR